MKNKRWVPGINSTLILCCFIAFLHACKKETIELPWVELSSGTDATLTDIHFINTLEGYAIGGKTWFEGIALSTVDGGDTWTAESLGAKQLFGLDINAQKNAYAVGIDGHFFSREKDSTNWIFYRTPRFDMLRDVAFNANNAGVLVGGVAFDEGTIMVVDSSMTITQVDTLGFQLNAVCFSDQETVHAAGYGIILRSVDSGKSWQENETTGDHFRAISFPDPNTGYIVGANGTILKSTNAGVTWEKIRNGDAIAVSDKAFRGIYFLDRNNGYLVGKGGLCWRTEDGGNQWTIIDGFPNMDFNAIWVVEGIGYIVGDGGRIIRFVE